MSGLNANLTENRSLSTHMGRNQKEVLVINSDKLNINYLLEVNSTCNFFLLSVKYACCTYMLLFSETKAFFDSVFTGQYSFQRLLTSC